MSAVAFYPQTPIQNRFTPPQNNHCPVKSSPLAPVSHPPSSSPGPASPVSEVQARRRGQYKSRIPSSTSIASSKNKSRYRTLPAAPIPFTLGPLTADAGQAAFLRERFKADCLKRSRRAREKGIQRRRASAASDASSDGFDTDMNVDEDDEADDNDGFDDELFCRVVANEKRRQAHAYALSYELDVGFAFDPELEDPTSWEELLQPSTSPSQSSRHQQDDSQDDEALLPSEEEVPDFDEYDLDDATWVEEYIASVPLEAIEAHYSTTSNSRISQEHQQQIDVTMG